MRTTIALAAAMTMVSALKLDKDIKDFVLEKPDPKWNTNDNAAKDI